MSATADEIEYWEVFRPEIAEYVDNSKIWVNPDTGKPITLCPWLRKNPETNMYTCDIYYDRPEDCRYYPSTIAEMINDECEMINEKDKANPRQAQRDLEQIMANNRSD